MGLEKTCTLHFKKQSLSWLLVLFLIAGRTEGWTDVWYKRWKRVIPSWNPYFLPVSPRWERQTEILQGTLGALSAVHWEGWQCTVHPLFIEEHQWHWHRSTFEIRTNHKQEKDWHKDQYDPIVCVYLDFVCCLPGPEEYPRVLDYSIFLSLLVTYSKNFTTRSSSWVVTFCTFLAQTLRNPDMTDKLYFIL